MDTIRYLGTIKRKIMFLQKRLYVGVQNHMILRLSWMRKLAISLTSYSTSVRPKHYISSHMLLLADLMPSLLLALPSLSLTPLVRSTSPAPVRQAGRARQGVRLDRGGCRVQQALH